MATRSIFGPTASRSRRDRPTASDTSRTLDNLLHDIEIGQLPAPAFYKPAARFNQHPSYTGPLERSLPHRLRRGSQWERKQVVTTYDETAVAGMAALEGVSVPGLPINPYATDAKREPAIDRARVAWGRMRLAAISYTLMPRDAVARMSATRPNQACCSATSMNDTNRINRQAGQRALRHRGHVQADRCTRPTGRLLQAREVQPPPRSCYRTSQDDRPD